MCKVIKISIRKTLTGIVLAAAIGLSGCGKSDNTNKYIGNSTIPLKDEGVYIQVDAAYNRGSAIATVDWDGDKDLDVLSSDGYGQVFLYKNNGGGKFVKSEKPLFEVPAAYNRGNDLDIVDIDGDGDLDVLSSDGYGQVHLYRNMTK